MLQISSKALDFLIAIKGGIILSVMAALVIMALEVAILGYRRSSVAAIANNTASARRDLLSYVLDVTGLLRILGHALTLGLGYMFGQLVRQYLHLEAVAGLPNIWLQLGAFLVAKSFFDYWLHRVMHTFPLLWEIHKYHHSAADMHVVTAHRESVLVAPWSAFYFAIPLGLIGSSPANLVAVGFLIELHALWIHSQFRFSFGKIGERILISPLAHRLHHSLETQHWGKNYGFLFSFWDHLFGTYFMDKTKGSVLIGVDDPVYTKAGWVTEMRHSLRSFWRELLALRSPLKPALSKQ